MKRLARVLNYHGSKYSQAPWLLAHAPPHACFVDAYGGSASIFTCKAPVDFEVYNDAGSDVVTFFQVLRDRPQDLARALALTPWSREEFSQAWLPSADPLERARRLLVRSWQSRGTAPPKVAKAHWKAGWRYQRRRETRHALFVDEWASLPEALLAFAERMSRVQIEHDDGVKVIRRYDSPTTLIYADPPYLPDVRSPWAGHAYEVEMSEQDHVDLAAALQELAGYALVCGYASPLYAELYEARGWVRRDKRVLDGAGNRKVESVWLSPRTAAALAAAHGPLFEHREVRE